MKAFSLRRYLLGGILLPVVAVIAAGAALLYGHALAAADIAYDRTLLASAKALGEQIEAVGEGPQLRVVASVPYSALEAFEADNRSRMYYRVSGFAGEMISGFDDLPPARPAAGDRPNVYAALVHFYDDRFRGEPVRMAVLLQPVAGPGGQGMATIQVAETLELRQALARSLLVRTLAQQAVLIALIAAVVFFVVQRGTRPVRALSAQLRAREPTDLSPLDAPGAPRELVPVVDAINAVMSRLAALLEHQKRFVRDASHQLRTPLAVLRTQVQSARRGDVDPDTALAEIDHTARRATELANQMLALAKVEQLRQQGLHRAPSVTAWDEVVRDVALDLSALLGEARLDFSLQVEPAPVRADPWALRELTRNLLHNAIKHSPRGAALEVQLERRPGPGGAEEGCLRIRDHGPGLGADLAGRLGQPFAASGPLAGSGLGLAICQEIVASLGGRLELRNRADAAAAGAARPAPAPAPAPVPAPPGTAPGAGASGLEAIVHLPLADDPPPRREDARTAGETARSREAGPAAAAAREALATALAPHRASGAGPRPGPQRT